MQLSRDQGQGQLDRIDYMKVNLIIFINDKDEKMRLYML